MELKQHPSDLNVCLDVRFSVREPVNAPGDVTTGYRVAISTDDGYGRHAQKAGSLTAIVLDGGTAEAFFEQVVIFGEYVALRNRKRDGGSPWTAAANRALKSDQPLNDTLLILDEICVLPKLRGGNIGLRAVYLFVAQLATRVGAVAIKPYPLQCRPAPFGASARILAEIRDEREKMGLDALPNDEALATRKLQQHFAQLGFTRVASTPYMLLSPTNLRMPDGYAPHF